MSKSWFEVDREGLRELQAGKHKGFIIRELVQNAWDENIKSCAINMFYDHKRANIEITDDAPDGFKDIRDAYTLFRHTSKRANPHQRGRFNLGEKQVLALAQEATITTTKGKVRFTQSGRTEFNSHYGRKEGSVVQLIVPMTYDEYLEMEEYAKHLLVPRGISYTVHGEPIEHREPLKVFTANLQTEIEGTDGVLRRSMRNTEVQIFDRNGSAILYEMGLPVQEIDCDYSINVLQKVPLSLDREAVLPAYLRDVYAEVLNAMHDTLTEERASEGWVREATMDERVSSEAMKDVIRERYGEKVVVANPFDARANDDALAAGYRVIRGSEMSKEEWDNVRRDGLIESSSQVFSRNYENATSVSPDLHMQRVQRLAQTIAHDFLGIHIQVQFLKAPGASISADFNGEILRFNVSNLGKSFFKEELNISILDLIIHELGHSAGMHMDMSYHNCITKLGAELTIKAINDPEYFKKVME